MLALLHIENIAVIKAADIEFGEGFNVLTGETGAGKSIVIDALEALLGERVSRDLIRSGAASGRVSGYFSNVSAAVKKALASFGFSPEEDGGLLLSRELLPDGKNICRIGVRPASLSFLREIAPLLVAIHGQQDTRGLADETTHLALLDRFSGEEARLEAYRQAYRLLLTIKKEMDGLKLDEAEKLRRMETFRFQMEEIAAAALSEEEEERLAKRRSLLRNAEKLLSALSSAYALLYGGEDGGGACASLSSAADAVSGVSGMGAEFSALYTKLSELKYIAEDAAGEIRALRDGMDFAPGELEEIEARMELIHRLKRKYGGSVLDVLAYYKSISAEYAAMELSDEKLKELTARFQEEYAKARGLALALSDGRKEAAARLAKRIRRELAGLEMKNARFEAALTPLMKGDKPRLSPSGTDECRFLFSANAGEPLKPLSKIASGGELSRVMLAMKNALAEKEGADTLIFDEIDAGVSGRTAARVGEKLYQAACAKQVLCVTHLAQIAAFADRHLLIEKGERDGRTYTSVTPIDGEEREKEMARIIAGPDITETTLKTAAEMISASKSRRQAIKEDRSGNHDSL